MISLNHPNIVHCYDFFENHQFFYLILEYLEGGELFERLLEKTLYCEEEARDLVGNILNGMKYCHERNIAHRDMKPENLILSSLRNNCEVKITDFGLATRVQTSIKKMKLHDKCGTPGYCAPEILSSTPYDVSVDMWSIGIIAYILLCGYPPFQDNDQIELFNKIKSGKFVFHEKYWESVSFEAKDFISHLLVLDPTVRYNVDEALLHPWLNLNIAKEFKSHILKYHLVNKDISSHVPVSEQHINDHMRLTSTHKFKASVRALIAIHRMQHHFGMKSDTNESSNLDADMARESPLYEGIRNPNED